MQIRDWLEKGSQLAVQRTAEPWERESLEWAWATPHKSGGGVQTRSSEQSWRLIGCDGPGELGQAASESSSSGKSALKGREQ